MSTEDRQSPGWTGGPQRVHGASTEGSQRVHRGFTEGPQRAHGGSTEGPQRVHKGSLGPQVSSFLFVFGGEEREDKKACLESSWA